MKSIFGMFFKKRVIGIDIGTFAVKLVEISNFGNKENLENYGQVQSTFIYKEKPPDEKEGAVLSADRVALAIKTLLQKARIKTKSAVFSLPDFSTFCTSFEIPNMPEKEIPNAIRYNASQYVTLPIEDVTLDWQVIKGAPDAKNSQIKVFLIAVPNQVVEEYQSIAKKAGLELHALEAEILGIARALAKETNKAICLVDIGMQTSSLSIIDKGFLKRSYSFNFSAKQLADTLASNLGVSVMQAEEVKNKEGIASAKEHVAKSLKTLVDPLLTEIKNLSAEFLKEEQKQFDEIYITGGTANLPGLKEYISETLQKRVSVPNCFSEISYPLILQKTLAELSPSFSAAVGVALGGLEK